MHSKTASIFILIFGFGQTANAQPAQPVRVELPIYGLLIDSPPAEFKKLNRENGSDEVALEHRKAMLLAWDTIILRNEDEAFNHMLTNQPVNPKDRIPWFDYMAEKYQVSIDLARNAAIRGRSNPIPPMLSDDNSDFNHRPYNGALVACEPLFGTVVSEAFVDGSSVLENLPMALAVLEDWTSTADCLFTRDIDSATDTLVTLEDLPNIGPALRLVHSPISKRAGLFLNYRNAVWSRIVSPERFAKIIDPKTKDLDVIADCKEAIKTIFARGVSRESIQANGFETWIDECKANKETHKKLANKLGFTETALDQMPIERLLILAMVADYDLDAQWNQQLFDLPVHESVRFAKSNCKDLQAHDFRRKDQLSTTDSILPFLTRPSDHWWTEQSLRSLTLLFYIRDYVGKKGELPKSLNEFKDRDLIFDPIANAPFVYRYLSPREAELDLAHYIGGARKTYVLSVPVNQQTDTSSQTKN